jgi:hypothetical protein
VTEATLYESIADIRGQIIDLITEASAPAVRQRVRADLVLDDLLVIANRLGRLNALGALPPHLQDGAHAVRTRTAGRTPISSSAI